MNRKINHKYEDGIEKSVLRITNWHHEVAGDREGRIFLSHTQTNNGFFFLLTSKHLILHWKKERKKGFHKTLNRLRYDTVMSFYHFNDITERHAAIRFFSFHRAGTGV